MNGQPDVDEELAARTLWDVLDRFDPGPTSVTWESLRQEDRDFYTDAIRAVLADARCRAALLRLVSARQSERDKAAASDL